MVRSHPILTACAVALLTPPAATAGPIGWGFRAEAPDGTVLRNVTGLTDLTYSDLFLPDPRTHGVPAGGPRPFEGHYSNLWESEATVTITDGASGQSGSFFLWSWWVQEYDIKPDGSEEQVYEGYGSSPWPDPVRLTLGGNVYEARGPGGELRVTVVPAVATPEPGTLALAGLGLGVIGVLRRRTGGPASRPPSGGG